jgi:transcription elongation factor GreA
VSATVCSRRAAVLGVVGLAQVGPRIHEVDPATWLTKPTGTLQLGHVVTIEKQDVATKRKHRFTFLVSTHGETASDPESGIECLPHTSPLASAVLGLPVGAQTQVTLPAGEAILTVLSIRNPTQAELDRLLTAIKPPESEEEEWKSFTRGLTADAPPFHIL